MDNKKYAEKHLELTVMATPGCEQQLLSVKDEFSTAIEVLCKEFDMDARGVIAVLGIVSQQASAVTAGKAGASLARAGASQEELMAKLLSSEVLHDIVATALAALHEYLEINTSLTHSQKDAVEMVFEACYGPETMVAMQSPKMQQVLGGFDAEGLIDAVLGRAKKPSLRLIRGNN